jgi:hypothetical protein
MTSKATRAACAEPPPQRWARCAKASDMLWQNEVTSLEGAPPFALVHAAMMKVAATSVTLAKLADG